MNPLKHISEVVLKHCLAAQPGEKILIVTDEEKHALAKEFETKSTTLLMTPIPEANGEEPPALIAAAMKKHPVILLITKKSLTHTRATHEAAEAGARIASMPGITMQTAKRTLDIDYQEVKRVNDKLTAILSEGRLVTLTSSLGTNLTFSIAGRKARPDTGILTKGMVGNLPAGEVFVAPVEGTANGKLFIDASMAGIGKLQEPLEFDIEEGRIKEVRGRHAAQLMQKLKTTAHKNVAELGIGTNPCAIITGSILEDEKVKGTCHIAFGNNAFFGGTVDVPFHADGIITKPTIEVDGKKIMKNGSLFPQEQRI